MVYTLEGIRQYFNFLGTRTFKSHSKLQNQGLVPVKEPEQTGKLQERF